jgi:hypothetical protein
VPAPQCIQCQSFCDVRGRPGFPAEPVFECFTLLCCSGCCPQGPANDSNFRGRCSDEEDPSKKWVGFFDGKFGWINKRPSRITAGTKRKLWIYVRADVPGPFACSTGPQCSRRASSSCYSEECTAGSAANTSQIASSNCEYGRHARRFSASKPVFRTGIQPRTCGLESTKEGRPEGDKLVQCPRANRFRATSK